MTISVVITTYNRPTKVCELIDQLKKCDLSEGEQIIVVDASDNVNTKLANDGEVIYLTSVRKNQPYQRYLGYLAAWSEILLYLDDDMEILDENVFHEMLEIFKDESVVGLGLAFENKHSDTFLNKTPKSAWSKVNQNNGFFQSLRSLTGYGKLPEGKFGWNGNRGPQPSVLSTTEWFSGGAFAARKSALFKNLNFQLFDLFEKRIGMGEDVLLAYTLSKQGKVLFYPNISFIHNDQKDSTYTTDFYSYAYRVIYSRLFISLEYARLNRYPSLLAHVKFHWYAIWRIIGQFINIAIKPSKNRRLTLKGSLQGWLKSINLSLMGMKTRNSFWNQEALGNLKQLKID
jgi:glycosyltransferase involved in cell wall biosynthesis